MIKVFVLSIVLYIVRAEQQIYAQCGGKNWNGGKNCASGLNCKYINEYYSQCLPGNNNHETNQHQSHDSINLPTLKSGFPGSKFKHGIAFDSVFSDNDYKKYDYISIWINTPSSENPSNTNFNHYYQGAMIKKCKQLGKIPFFYGYIIAFEARAKQGIQDCDIDPNYNLCHKGANFIRNNRALLVSRYAHQASEIAKALNDRNAPCVFIMEPDFWQFYGDKRQEGGTLSGEYMRALFDDFAKEIKKQLPNAKISWDLSAWIRYDGLTKWWGYFKSSPYIDFVHTSGGQGHAGSSEYKPGELKWSDFSRITGKRIIGDCGYGVGGASSNNCGAWNYNNKKARMADGVIALTSGIGASQQQANLDRLSL